MISMCNSVLMFSMMMLFSCFLAARSACTEYPLAVSKVKNCINGKCSIDIVTNVRLPMARGNDVCLTYKSGNETRFITLNITASEQLLVLNDYMHCGDLMLVQNTSCTCNNVPNACSSNFDENRYADKTSPYRFAMNTMGPSSGCTLSWLSPAEYCTYITPVFDFRFDSYVVSDAVGFVTMKLTNHADSPDFKNWDTRGVTTLRSGGIKADVSVMGTFSDPKVIGKMIVSDVRSHSKMKVMTDFNTASTNSFSKFCHTKMVDNKIFVDWTSLKSMTNVRPLNCYEQRATLTSGQVASHIEMYNNAPDLDSFSGLEWNYYFNENEGKTLAQYSTNLDVKRAEPYYTTYNKRGRRYGIKTFDATAVYEASSYMEIGYQNFHFFPSSFASSESALKDCEIFKVKGPSTAGPLSIRKLGTAFQVVDSCTTKNVVNTLSYGRYSGNFTKLYAFDHSDGVYELELDQTGLVTLGNMPKDTIYRDTRGGATALIAITGTIEDVALEVDSPCIDESLLGCRQEGGKIYFTPKSTCGEGKFYVSFNETNLATSRQVSSSDKEISIPLQPNVHGLKVLNMTICSNTALSCASCTVAVPENYTKPVEPTVIPTPAKLGVWDSAYKSVSPLVNHSVWGYFNDFAVFVAASAGSLLLYEVFIWVVFVVLVVSRFVLYAMGVPPIVVDLLKYSQYIIYISITSILIHSIKYTGVFLFNFIVSMFTKNNVKGTSKPTVSQGFFSGKLKKQ